MGNIALIYGLHSLYNWVQSTKFSATILAGRLMSTYLDTSKIQASGRLSLSPSALRNLKVDAGDSVEIFFDETLGCLLITPVKNINSTEKLPKSTRNGVKSKSGGI
jgi:hypothetical protein